MVAVFLVMVVGALGVVWALNTGSEVLALAEPDHEVTAQLSEPIGRDLTFLVVGSDSREGIEDLTFFGPAGGERGDVIMLVRLDAASGEARILSVPRDLWVEIPGHGEDKINAAFAYGGPSLMVHPIRETLEIAINHYV